MKDGSRWLRVLWLVVALLITAWLVLPFVLQCFYTVPSSDDFLNNSISETDDGALLRAFKSAKSLYLGWQGTFFGGFVGSLLTPWYYWGYAGVHIALLLITVLFIVSLYWFIMCAVALVFEKPLSFSARLLIADGIFGVMTLASDSSETFTWLSSAWVYTIPLSLVFLGGALLAKAVSRNSGGGTPPFPESHFFARVAGRCRLRPWAA